ncbi:cation/H+ exchanger [Mycena metata]|uniref:Cation/H+ exchanger n=1 Tax=Mycena metata TaxID=1033252 RepID=A0AAD7J607_9AGAR|nr:cation/H+ exchanger [Mycena metata]
MPTYLHLFNHSLFLLTIYTCTVRRSFFGQSYCYATYSCWTDQPTKPLSLSKTSVPGLAADSSPTAPRHIIPLGLGAALGVGVYREFIDPKVNFGYFILFVAVAVGITAFPVLCRILTELKLLDTTVGVVTLSAGVGNDVVGWILLALAVALVNASTGLTALYVLLASAGFVLFLLFPVRWGYIWLARRTGSLEQGSPTTFMMTITLIMILFSAFFTDIIGVHPIFGGFLAGLVIPHENGFAISLTEKANLVSILLLPIYFALSGLKTNLGLLNTGITWAYIVIICLVAFTSKFVACGLTAYLSGFKWREAGAIGALMSCKGLVELIVLNIGLSAGILDPRTFSMFVLHALVLTFMTTPLTLLFYPAHLRVHEGSNTAKIGDADALPRRSSESEVKTKFSVVLDKIEQLPAAMTLAQLIQPSNVSPPSYASSITDEKGLEAMAPPSPIPRLRVSIDALRLIELTNRTSAVLKSQEADVLLHNDPIVSVFRTFGYLNRMIVSAALSVVGYDEFPDAIAQHATEFETQMVILPWSRGATSVLAEEEPGRATGVRNPFDGVFHKTTTQDQTSSVVYSDFIRKVFQRSPTDVALFVDRGMSLALPSGAAEQQLFLPFIGGPDDRLALAFLVQLCSNPAVHATVVRVRKIDSGVEATDAAARTAGHGTTQLTMAAADTVYGQHNTQTQLVSDTADNLLWDRFATGASSQNASVRDALSRITFRTQEAREPLHKIVELVDLESSKMLGGRNLMVIVGRSRRMAVESHKAELHKLIGNYGSSIGSAVPKTLGDVGAALVASGSSASLLVLQAAVSVF